MPLAGNITERLADLNDVVVMIHQQVDLKAPLRIERSGKLVDRIYGLALAGEPVARLTPERDDAENEAAVVFKSGRTLMMEDEVELMIGPTRIARLYLPLADGAGNITDILVGIARVS